VRGKGWGYVYVLLGAACFASLSVLVKLAYRYDVDPLTLLALRLVIATLLVWPIGLALCPAEVRVGRKELAYLILIGPFGSAFSSVAYFYALRSVEASVAIVLFYTYPIVVNILAVVVLREPLSRRLAVSLALTFVGVVLAIGAYHLSAWRVDIVGASLALLAGTCVAVYTLGMKRATDHHHPFVVVMYVTTGSALLLSVLRPPTAFLELEPPVVLIAATMAVLTSVVGMLLYLSGLEVIGPGRMAIASMFEPAVVIVLALLILGERLGADQLMGVAAVLAGIVLLELRGRQKGVHVVSG